VKCEETETQVIFSAHFTRAGTNNCTLDDRLVTSDCSVVPEDSYMYSYVIVRYEFGSYL
jgi:hypothetical protein